MLFRCIIRGLPFVGTKGRGRIGFFFNDERRTVHDVIVLMTVARRMDHDVL